MTFAARPGWPRRAIPNGLVRRRTPPPGLHLTFDDGPDPAHTPGVLDRLRDRGIRATFFLIGERARRHPALARRVAAEGHSVGNHTMTHPVWPLSVGAAEAWAEIGRAQRAILECAGVAPTRFRPPLGRLAPGIVAAAWGGGLEIVNWSLDTGDWRCRSAADAERCAAELAQGARPGDIVLLHDANPWVATILDLALPRLSLPMGDGIDLG